MDGGLLVPLDVLLLCADMVPILLHGAGTLLLRVPGYSHVFDICSHRNHLLVVSQLQGLNPQAQDLHGIHDTQHDHSYLHLLYP